MGEPKMIYVLMTQYGPTFAHEDFERVMQRASALLKGDAESGVGIDPARLHVVKVEAE